jgi:serine/threonine protein kinase
MELRDLLTVLVDACDGLVALHQGAHGYSYVHGDIKPDNIVMTSDGRGRLIDFGVMHQFKARRAGLENRTPFMGGPAGYCAPEARYLPYKKTLSSAAVYCVGAFSDVFSLAASIVRVMAFPGARHEQYIADANRFGVAAPWLQWDHMPESEKQGRQSALARRLVSRYKSKRNGELARQLAHVLLQCLQLRLERRPRMATLRAALVDVLAQVDAW